MTSQNKKTHFGFKEIEENEKAQMVRGVFSFSSISLKPK